MKENSKISEREKINSWLEKQILIWNGTPISKLYGKSRVSQLSPNIKVEKNDIEHAEKNEGTNKSNLNEEENPKQEISGQILTKIDNQNNPDGNMKLRFKDWSDLHNYLLVSMRREQKNNI
ncbi:uncharacterized protein cubi_01206 [Cryptosporidium ubiquitum]|uniref:Uncharacterized protein n=1 Tax=Cryptosporidium ubiquitum TaxID=857276 RepID=A0A1J4MJC3_9CRYT|nr:uncharacterized protein cubi_01206 [Cryptosporidium ubiquitum]OII74362.1 hypothetical protein cubi_01206 [Cryptosporidium ubiquitum]